MTHYDMTGTYIEEINSCKNHYGTPNNARGNPLYVNAYICGASWIFDVENIEKLSSGQCVPLKSTKNMRSMQL